MKRRRALGWIGLFLSVLWLAACRTAQAPSSVAVLPTETAAPTETATPTLTPTLTATTAPTATNTPTFAGVDLQRLHLGWIWPQGEARVRAEFAVGPEGVIYINDAEGRLHAVRLPGEVLWTFDGPQEGISPPVLGTDGETLTFVTVGPDKLYVLGTDGEVRRSVDIPEQPYSYPRVAPDGMVYLDTRGGGYRFSPEGGEPAQFEWSAYGPEWAALDPQGRLYAADLGEVWVHSSQGERMQTCPTAHQEGSLAGWPSGGFVYSTREGDLIASDPECRELWRYARGEAEPSYVGGWGPIAVAADGSVYAARENGEIVALDAGGKPRWKHEPDEAFGHAIDLLPGAGGSLFAVTQYGQVAAFDAQGERAWSYSLPGAGEPGPLQLTPDGGLALTQGGRLWYFTPDPAVVAAEPTPAPPPADQKAAEEEIVSFMLDYAGCQVESIFIWGPLSEEEKWTSVDRDHPFRVWWCSDGKFTERQDMLAAIAEARKLIEEAGMEVRTYPVSTFEFGIDLADDLQNATVYVGWTRGPLWGQGDLYTLKRSRTGEWWIVGQKTLWVS